MTDPLTATEYERAMETVEDELPDVIGEAVSNCCNTVFYSDSDICSKCHEHAVGIVCIRVGQRPDGEKVWAIVQVDVNTGKAISLDLES